MENIYSLVTSEGTFGVGMNVPLSLEGNPAGGRITKIRGPENGLFVVMAGDQALISIPIHRVIRVNHILEVKPEDIAS
ncbi:MAG: hypothetical protein OXO51_15540 [Gemmatimonadota bacterium]|nr:hypothetical protein [Gemmatimonadota bacterium]